MFDTFTERFSDADRKAEGAKARADAKSTLLAPPTAEFMTYLVVAAGCVAAWAYAAVGVAYGTLTVAPELAQVLSFTAGFGPVVAAVVVSLLFRSSGGTSLADPKSPWGSLLQWTVGTAFCSVPVYLACIRSF